uniref:AAA family ATPase n=1 Tax=uncultured Psychrobacter sp. TaxID=259303 RepID=UPI002624059A|nr:AAA family ATPase [uncultured Psychrobacter sp.]
MEKIYLNNYKGFRNQFIQLDDVNFLVGENSTGKTSLLKIINLLSRQEFWMGFEFNNSEVELGYFNEIYNKRSSEKGKKTFQIGIERSVRSSRKTTKNLKLILDFNEVQSVPNLFQVKVRLSNFDVLIRFSDKQVRYWVKECTEQDFKEWVNDLNFSGSFKIFKHPRSLPLFLIITLIDRELNGENQASIGLHNLGIFERFKWIAPIRAKAKRIYESYKIKFSPEGNHIPSLLRKILTDKSSGTRKKIINTLEKFGKQSNLFDEIVVKELGEKNISPFEIIIKYKDLEVKLPNVGYGVSQSLPLIIEILSSTRTIFSVQQPEVHLHPKAQSAFGSFLFNSVKNDSNRFIIETHSDFTINRLRYELLKNQDKSNVKIKCKVLFFEREDFGNVITELNINENGAFIDEVPNTYREFFIDEELKLLEL